MEFTIACPLDGPIEVGLEDIETVVLKDAERADITFICPHCGSSITVSAIVPAFLLSALEALAEGIEGPREARFAVIGVVKAAADDAETEPSDEQDARTDAYCEYFRRQLERVVSVEDALAEMDAGRS